MKLNSPLRRYLSCENPQGHEDVYFRAFYIQLYAGQPGDVLFNQKRLQCFHRNVNRLPYYEVPVRTLWGSNATRLIVVSNIEEFGSISSPQRTLNDLCSSMP